MAAVISVDGGKVRSPLMGPEGLEWFEARMGVIAPVLPELAPSPETLAAIDAAGAWPPLAPLPRTDQQTAKRPARRRRERRRGHRGGPTGPRLSSSTSPKGPKPSTLYLAGPPDVDALFRLLVAARQSDPHPRRLLLFIADGADWIWWRVSLFFPAARQVLDIYHAAQHVASAALACWGEDSPKTRHWRQHARTMLLAHGGPERIRRALRHQLQHARPLDPEELRKNLAYMDEHQDRMPYAELYAQGLPVGSGVMESAVKQMSTQRLRQPGMMWTKQGAEKMLRLRAAHLSGDLQHTVARQHAQLHARTADYALSA